MDNLNDENLSPHSGPGSPRFLLPHLRGLLGANLDVADPIMIEDAGTRLSRAIQIALQDPKRDLSDLALDVTPARDQEPAIVRILGGDPFSQGVLTGRLEAAARVEDVPVRVVVG